jgi:hypothetical protein
MRRGVYRQIVPSTCSADMHRILNRPMCLWPEAVGSPAQTNETKSARSRFMFLMTLHNIAFIPSGCDALSWSAVRVYSNFSVLAAVRRNGRFVADRSTRRDGLHLLNTSISNSLQMRCLCRRGNAVDVYLLLHLQ